MRCVCVLQRKRQRERARGERVPLHNASTWTPGMAWTATIGMQSAGCILCCCTFIHHYRIPASPLVSPRVPACPRVSPRVPACPRVSPRVPACLIILRRAWTELAVRRRLCCNSARSGSGALAANATSQLHVFALDGDALGVDGVQVGVLEKLDEVRLGRLLRSGRCRRLPLDAFREL